MELPVVKYNVVVAAALLDPQNPNMGIGYKGQIPWKIPADMKRFKELTMGHIVIMGKNTWLSIPEKFRPLPGRINIVISQTFRAGEVPRDVIICSALWRALSVASDIINKNPQKEIFIIGGGFVYDEAISKFASGLSKLYITMINGFNDEPFDAFFPVKKYSDYGNPQKNPAVIREEDIIRMETKGTYSFHTFTFP
jgi:dihydrofolate reductase